MATATQEDTIEARVKRGAAGSCPKCGRPKTVIEGAGRLRYRCRDCDCKAARQRYQQTPRDPERPSVHTPPRYRRGGKDGKIIASHGYVVVYLGKGHPQGDRNGFAYEHRLVAGTKLGRPLASGEHVHHIDGNKQNNTPDNLEVVRGHAEHALRHRTRDDLRRPGEPNPLMTCECGCGKEFPKFDGSGRPRRRMVGHAKLPTPARESVLSLFADDPTRQVTVVDVTALVGCTNGTARAMLGRAIDSGHLIRINRGVYALADPWRAEVRARLAP